MTCKVKFQQPNEWHCARCGFTWDTNDPQPPTCLTAKQYGTKTLKELKGIVDAQSNKDKRRSGTVSY